METSKYSYFVNKPYLFASQWVKENWWDQWINLGNTRMAHGNKWEKTNLIKGWVVEG